MAEKDQVDFVHDQGEEEDQKHFETRVITGNEAFNEAMIKEPPLAFSKGQLMIYAFSLVGFFCSTVNGYDGSLINLLFQNHWWVDYFDGDSGIWQGIVSSMYQIGGVAALPFVGPVVDGFGRRIGMFTGSVLIIVGTIIQGLAHGPGQFMGGRFLLGFGVSLVASAGPMYVVEINHPAYRGRVGAMYNTLWFSGAILCSGANLGAIQQGGNFSWRLITWMQLVFSSLVVMFVFFLPESPRWQYVHNKQDSAKATLAKYHGGGNPDSVWVTLQLHEYEEFLNMDGADKRWWDYRALFRNRAAVYRLSCNIMISIFSQWAGNAVLSYFLTDVLDTCGYTDQITQAKITLYNNVQQFIFAILGAVIVDKVGRRPLLLFSFIGVTIVWLGMTVASAEFANSQNGTDAQGNPIYTNHAASRASLGMIFMFGSIFSIGITPLQALYPVEVLSFEMRAKGMAFSNLAVNAAGLLNQFAWPVALKKIGWKTYIVFTLWDALQALVIFFVIPETKGYTLEELDNIFDAKNPVKASTLKKAVAINARGDVLETREA